jgi:hypothetical protein
MWAVVCSWLGPRTSALSGDFEVHPSVRGSQNMIFLHPPHTRSTNARHPAWWWSGRPVHTQCFSDKAFQESLRLGTDPDWGPVGLFQEIPSVSSQIV